MLGKAFRERTGSLKRNVQFFECLLECVCIFSINHKLHSGFIYSGVFVIGIHIHVFLPRYSLTVQ